MVIDQLYQCCGLVKVGFCFKDQCQWVLQIGILYGDCCDIVVMYVFQCIIVGWVYLVCVGWVGYDQYFVFKGMGVDYFVQCDVGVDGWIVVLCQIDIDV